MRRNDNDFDGSDSTERESPRRKAVLDDVTDRDRGPLADAGPRTAGRSNAGGTSRRSLLAAAGALSATALTGCLGGVTGGTSDFDAQPVMLPIPAPEEQREHGAWMALAGANRVSVTDEVRQFGLSREVRATSWGATYVSAIDRETRESLGLSTTSSSNGTGPTQVGEVSLVSTPRVEVGGTNLNPATELSPEDVLGTLRARADGGDDDEGGSSVVSEHEVDGFDRTGRHLRRAYSGTVRELSDVRFSDAGAGSFDDAAPAVFTAEAQLTDGRETSILGAVERLDLDGTHVFKTGWVPVDDRERALQAVAGGRRLAGSEIRQADLNEQDGAFVVELPDCTVGDFVQQCLDGCEGHDCEVRCLVKFAYMTVEEAERWLRWCPLIAFPHEYPPVEVVEDIGGVQTYDGYTHE